MARQGRKSKAAHPFVQRLIEEPELRTSLHDAVSSARTVFTQLNSHKAPAKTLADDRKLQDEVRNALETLHEATHALVAEQQTVKKRKRRRGPRLLLLLSFGTAVSFVACPWLRNKALDKLFGAEEEFQYSPPPAPTTSAAPEPASSESPVSAA
jgi:hypothetical protein